MEDLDPMLYQGASARWLAERIRTGRRAAFAALFAVAATAGIASATIPSDGVISACYSKSGGTLRVIDPTVTKCGKSETSLAWNVHGPAGPQGEQGPEGPAGPAGANGVSSGFGVTLEGPGLDIDSANAAGIVVVSKTMPAGNYVLTARVNVNLPSVSPGACWIPGDSATFAGTQDPSEEHITVTSAVAHPGGAIELRCAKSFSGFSGFLVSAASLTGVRVDTLD